MVKKDKHYYSQSEKRKEQAGSSSSGGKYFYGMYAYRLSKIEQFLLVLGGFGFLYFIHGERRFDYVILTDQILLINTPIVNEINSGSEFKNNFKSNYYSNTAYSLGLAVFIAQININYWMNNH